MSSRPMRERDDVMNAADFASRVGEALSQSRAKLKSRWYGVRVLNQRRAGRRRSNRSGIGRGGDNIGMLRCVVIRGIRVEFIRWVNGDPWHRMLRVPIPFPTPISAILPMRHPTRLN